jgi:hypothetical protein
MNRNIILKNTIISFLLVYLFANVPGWSVYGFSKLLLCTVFITLLTVLITFIDFEFIK